MFVVTSTKKALNDTAKQEAVKQEALKVSSRVVGLVGVVGDQEDAQRHLPPCQCRQAAADARGEQGGTFGRLVHPTVFSDSTVELVQNASPKR